MTTTLTSQQRKVLEDTTAVVRFRLIDENGGPIDPIVLDSLVLTLYVKGAPDVKIKWRKFQAVFLAEHPLCEHCQGAATDVHHKLKLADYPQLKYEPSNLIALCTSCHSRITARGG